MPVQSKDIIEQIKAYLCKPFTRSLWNDKLHIPQYTESQTCRRLAFFNILAQHMLPNSVDRMQQVDNPDREAIYPVVLAMPAAAPGLNLSILPETLPAGSQSRSSALRARAAAWKRRPAGVLCVERLEARTLDPHRICSVVIRQMFQDTHVKVPGCLRLDCCRCTQRR